MNAEEARLAAVNSKEKVRQTAFDYIEAMAKNGNYFTVVSSHYPELIDELLSLGYDTKVNEWGSLEISWKPKN
jgi:uncharacterized protein (DUF2249 family)